MWLPLVLVGSAWLATAGTATGASQARGPLGVVAPATAESNLFSRLDPVSLAPVGPSIELGEYHGGWSFSPDGSMIAFGIQARTGVKVVDVARLKTIRDIPQSVFAGQMAWLTPNRLVTLVADHLPTLVDPAAGRTLRQLPGNACEGYASTPTASTPKALVWFTRTRLVTGDASGRLRSASTPGIGSTCEGKGVAADRRGRRAWIAGPSGVVEVDLQTMRVTARVRGSVPRGSRRVSVVWTARHQVTVAHLTAGFRPAGVELVDTEAHTRRIIDSAGGGVRYAQGRLLVFDGGDGVQRSPAHRGLRVYDTRGRLRYRRLRGKHVWNVQVRGGRAWLLGSTGVTVMDVRSGKVLSRWAGRAPDDLTFLTPPL